MPILHDLIEDANHTEFEAFLSKHPELVDECSSSGDTPLHIAAWQNEAEMLQRLLEVGANINARGDSGFSPLHYAAKHGAVQSAQTLIAMGANLDARDERDFWPIHFALRGREPECPDIADLLEAAGASLDLSCHVMRGDEAKLRKTLAQNPDAIHQGPLARDLIYDAVLWILCQPDRPENLDGKAALVKRHRGIIDALIGAGADVNDFKFSGQTALQFARTHHNPFLAEVLIQHGAKG